MLLIGGEILAALRQKIHSRYRPKLRGHLFVRRTEILRHLGYNVAYWNLPQRRVTRGIDGWRVGDLPLRFFHFSGFSIRNPDALSKHQDRYLTTSSAGVADLCVEYISKLEEVDYAFYSSIPYSYGRFESGRLIHPFMRQIIAEYDRSALPRPTDLFANNGTWFDDVVPSGFVRPMTRMMEAVWKARPDVRAAFDIGTESGWQGFTEWFCDTAPREEGIDEISTSAARIFLAPITAKFTPKQAIWLVALEDWLNKPFQGPAKEAKIYYGESIEINDLISGNQTPLTRGLLLTLLSRDDLLEHFVRPNGLLAEGFLTWVVRSGFVEQAVHPDFISEDLLAWLSKCQTEGSDGPRLELYLSTGEPNKPIPYLPSTAAELQRLALDRQSTNPDSAGREFPFEPSWEIPLVGPVVRRMWFQRADVSAAFPLDNRRSYAQFLLWYLIHGSVESGFSFDKMGSDVITWLSLPVKNRHSAANGLILLWSERRDLRERYWLLTKSSLRKLEAWLDNEANGSLAKTALGKWWIHHSALTRSMKSGIQNPKIYLIGSNRPTGRGEDLRMTAAALHAVGQNFSILDIDDIRVAARTIDRAAGIVIVHLNAETALQDSALIRQAFPNCRYIGYWAWELERFPSRWRHAFAAFDEIWSSSRFALAAISASSYRPVRLVPMAVAMPEPAGAPLPRELANAGTAFIFLYAFDFRSYVDRKNPEAAIKAFSSAFPDKNDDVRLVLKTTNAEHTPQRSSEIVQLASADPRILLIDRELDRSAYSAMMNRMDCFVSPHRSEGFGRGPAECLLLGKPLIVTAYSGNMDYCSESNAWLIPYELVQVKPGAYVDWSDQVWAAPDLNALTDAMLDVRINGKQSSRPKAGQALIAERYSVSSVGKAVSVALKSLEINPPEGANRTKYKENRVKSKSPQYSDTEGS